MVPFLPEMALRRPLYCMSTTSSTLSSSASIRTGDDMARSKSMLMVLSMLTPHPRTPFMPLNTETLV